MNTQRQSIQHRFKPSGGAGALLILTALSAGTTGCDILCPFFPESCAPFISDGALHGINGWDVSATVDVEPNTGSLGTPIRITVDFSRGANDVASIEFEDHGGPDCTLLRTWRGIIFKRSASRWEMPEGRLFLTGNSGIAHFVALNSRGERIAIGDVRINDGCNINARSKASEGQLSDGLGVFTEVPPY